MVTADDYSRFVGIAWRLDRLRWVPRDVLAELVMKDGECVWAFTDGDPPEMTAMTQLIASWLFGYARDVPSRTSA